jgi:hypothetical protein
MMNKHSTTARWLAILGTILALTLVNLLFGLAWPPLLTQAGATLPPREPPRSVPDKGDKADKGQAIGAYLELQAQPPQTGLWTVIQWQDSTGNWQNVEGWQGTLDVGGKKVWWVEAKHFGKGPFRWVITQNQNGPLLAASQPFSLPKQANEIAKIEVSLTP